MILVVNRWDHEMIWNDMIWYEMIRYDMIWYDMIWLTDRDERWGPRSGEAHDWESEIDANIRLESAWIPSCWCYAMLCYAMTWHDMLCHTIPCHAMPKGKIFTAAYYRVAKESLAPCLSSAGPKIVNSRIISSKLNQILNQSYMFNEKNCS
jgi:hypothetical protein